MELKVNLFIIHAQKGNTNKYLKNRVCFVIPSFDSKYMFKKIHELYEFMN